jgi:hypothetical protein
VATDCADRDAGHTCGRAERKGHEAQRRGVRLPATRDFPVNRFPRTESLCWSWRAGHGSFIFRANGAAFHYQPELRGTRHGIQLRAGNSPGQVHPERKYRVAALGGRFVSRLRSAAGISGRVTGKREVIGSSVGLVPITPFWEVGRIPGSVVVPETSGI